jgi:hypothetical protein
VLFGYFQKGKLKMQIKEIQTCEEISQTFELFLQIYHQLNYKTYATDILKMMQQGYKMAAVFEEKSKKKIYIGAIGVRITKKLCYGQTLEIEDFVTGCKKDNIEVAKILIGWAKLQAKIMSCCNIISNLETKRREAQNILSHEKFILDGFLFRSSHIK